MKTEKDWFVRSEEGKVYGPANVETLVVWAQEGRIEPSSFVSQDRISWVPAQTMEALEMKWLVEIEPGRVFGPFNRVLATRLATEYRDRLQVKFYRLHEFPVDQDPPPVEKIVEKIVEKVVEVPVEKIVEKIVEKRVEVPVEKIVEKIVEVPVPEPARTEIVVPQVIEPTDRVPPAKSPGNLFKDMDVRRLSALESAARQELAKSRRMGFSARFFGGK